MSGARNVSVATDGAGKAIWVTEVQVLIPGGPKLSTAITAGATVTSLACATLPTSYKMLAGQQVSVDFGTGKAEFYTLSADVALGATAIPVNSQVAAYAHTIGAVIAMPLEAQVVILGRSDGSVQEPAIPVDVVRLAAGEDLNNNWQIAVTPDEWVLTALPAGNIQASVTKALVLGRKHVLRSIVATITADSPPSPAPSATAVFIRDGASGTGAIIWSAYLPVFGQSGYGYVLQLSGLKIPTTNGNAMTVEFLAAAGAKTLESIAISGITEF